MYTILVVKKIDTLNGTNLIPLHLHPRLWFLELYYHNFLINVESRSRFEVLSCYWCYWY